MPPFEGWDEYQHLAYITHLQEHGKRPVLTKDTVPRDLLQNIVGFPVSNYMLEQTKQTGAVDYKTYFSDSTSPKYSENHKDISLYQAQHGELYYQLMLPILERLPGETSILTQVFLLRIINFSFIMLSLISILWLIKQKVKDRLYAGLLGLLIISQPLLLINSLRISSDALAILLGTLVIIIGLSPKLRMNFVVVIAAGIFLGLSCRTKSISFVLFPFWFCCLAASWLNKEITTRKLLLLLVLSYSTALTVLFDYFSFNIRNYGMLFVMQETLINKANHTGLSDILQAVKDSDIFTDIFNLWVKESIWVGGWSFLKVHDIRNISLVVISISLLAWIYRIITTFRIERSLVQLETSLLCFVLCLLTTLSISWHYIQCVITWGAGRATSCPWYLCASLPFFLFFVFDSAGRWSARTCSILMLTLVGLYLYADMRGSFTMMSFYSGGATGMEALTRLATLRPDGFGTFSLILTAALFILLSCMILNMQIRLLFEKKIPSAPVSFI